MNLDLLFRVMPWQTVDEPLYKVIETKAVILSSESEFLPLALKSTSYVLLIGPLSDGTFSVTSFWGACPNSRVIDNDKYPRLSFEEAITHSSPFVREQALKYHPERL